MVWIQIHTAKCGGVYRDIPLKTIFLYEIFFLGLKIGISVHENDDVIVGGTGGFKNSCFCFVD